LNKGREDTDMVNQHSKKERRKFARVKNKCVIMSKISSPASGGVISRNKEFNAIMLDLSIGGMAFLNRSNIPKNTLLTNKFILINNITANQARRLRLVEVKAKALYSLLTKKGMYRIGLQFTRLSKDARIFINKRKEG
jgi:c-di-GMP-binding flagellar brake protein YcgR